MHPLFCPEQRIFIFSSVQGSAGSHTSAPTVFTVSSTRYLPKCRCTCLYLTVSELLEPELLEPLWIQVSLNLFSFFVCVYMSFSLSLRPSPCLSFPPSIPPFVRRSMISGKKFLAEWEVWPARSFKQLIQQWWAGPEWKKASSTMLQANPIAQKRKGLNGLQLWPWKRKGKETQKCPRRSKQRGWRGQLAVTLRLPAWVTDWESGGFH